MLSFLSGPNPDCHLGLQLRNTLKAFHKELRKHCGCTGGPSLSQGRLQELDVGEKLRQLVQLLAPVKEEQQQKVGGDHVTTLQRLITCTMLAWARQEVQQPQLIQEIFALLFRQYDEVSPVAVVPVTMVLCYPNCLLTPLSPPSSILPPPSSLLHPPSSHLPPPSSLLSPPSSILPPPSSLLSPPSS